MSAKEILMTNDSLVSLTLTESRLSEFVTRMAAMIAENRNPDSKEITITQSDMDKAGDLAMQGMDFAMLKVPMTN